MTANRLKSLLKDNWVNFSHYRKGYLYYLIAEQDDESTTTYCFPVPIEDVGDATFGSVEKAILFMRYIRKASEEGSFAKMVS